MMNTAREPAEATKAKLPADHEPFEDKYFPRSTTILEGADLNPEVSYRFFTREEGSIPDDAWNELIAAFEKYKEPGFSVNGGELYITENDQYGPKDTLAVVKGKAQDLIDFETMELEILSHQLTAAHPEKDHPDPADFGANVREVAAIYDEVDVPLLYFGARHYHWSQDEELSDAALKEGEDDMGAVACSTDVGAATRGQDGVGTIPHALVLTLAGSDKYDRDSATLGVATEFDTYIDDDVPRVTLIDTFNKEIDDALEVAEYFDDKHNGDDWTHGFRIDTCGENYAQGVEEHDIDDGYRTGTGVTIEAVKELRTALIEEGYGENTEIFLSSGFGKPDKAREFVEAQKEFREETRQEYGDAYDLFHGVGAGAFDTDSDEVHVTADIYEVNGEPMAKNGREQDLEEMEQYIDDEMKRVI
jgi:nicotinate phosphoribosyltransferase